MKIGFVLPSLPNYSETFFVNKILGLVELGLVVKVFVGSNNNINLLPKKIPIIVQPDINRRILLLVKIFVLFIKKPMVVYRFIKIEHESGRKWKNIFINILINSHILSQKLDWLHFGFATMGINRENVAQAIGAKSAVSFRGYDIILYPHKHLNCYDLLWKKIDKVHTISNNLFNKAIDIGLDKNISMKKITPAIDTHQFKPLKFEGIHNPVRILTIARLKWVKGIEYAIGAMKNLVDKGIKIEYKIIGSGEYYEPIKYMIDKFDLNESVLLIGEKKHDEIRTYLEYADIYIQPSIDEGFCNAVLEAQAMGILCIVTDGGGLPENILDEQSGWIVGKRSSKYLSDRIIKILSMDNNRLKKISIAAINRVRDKYDLLDQHKMFLDFYE